MNQSTASNPSQRRRQLYALLGDLPPRRRPISAARLGVEEYPAYTLERLSLDLNGIQPVPALFSLPRSGAAPYPVVLYHHAHGGQYQRGKDELIHGAQARQSPPYAVALAEMGIAALCIDTWAFGERQGPGESAIFKEMLWKGRVMWGMMVYDSLRAMDYLLSRPEIDPARIATLGMSMGSTMAWWLAALDERIKLCIDLCCLTDFQDLIETGGLDLHGIYYYVPSLLKHFTTAEINALIAPRRHLSLAGIHDPLTPPAGLDRIDAGLRRVYAACGASDHWELRRYDTGHFETPQMRADVVAYLERYL